MWLIWIGRRGAGEQGRELGVRARRQGAWRDEIGERAVKGGRLSGGGCRWGGWKGGAGRGQDERVTE